MYHNRFLSNHSGIIPPGSYEENLNEGLSMPLYGGYPSSQSTFVPPGQVYTSGEIQSSTRRPLQQVQAPHHVDPVLSQHLQSQKQQTHLFNSQHAPDTWHSLPSRQPAQVYQLPLGYRNVSADHQHVGAGAGAGQTHPYPYDCYPSGHQSYPQPQGSQPQQVYSGFYRDQEEGYVMRQPHPASTASAAAVPGPGSNTNPAGPAGISLYQPRTPPVASRQLQTMYPYAAFQHEHASTAFDPGDRREPTSVPIRATSRPLFSRGEDSLMVRPCSAAAPQPHSAAYSAAPAPLTPRTPAPATATAPAPTTVPETASRETPSSLPQPTFKLSTAKTPQLADNGLRVLTGFVDQILVWGRKVEETVRPNVIFEIIGSLDCVRRGAAFGSYLVTLRALEGGATVQGVFWEIDRPIQAPDPGTTVSCMCRLGPKASPASSSVQRTPRPQLPRLQVLKIRVVEPSQLRNLRRIAYVSSHAVQQGALQQPDEQPAPSGSKPKPDTKKQALISAYVTRASADSRPASTRLPSENSKSYC